MPGVLQPLLGAAVILSIAYAASTNRRIEEREAVRRHDPAQS